MMFEIGKIAYDAYVASAGIEKKEFSDLSPQERSAWYFAAEAVEDALMRTMEQTQMKKLPIALDIDDDFFLRHDGH